MSAQGCAARGPAERALLRAKLQLRAAAAAQPRGAGPTPAETDPRPEPKSDSTLALPSRARRAAAAAAQSERGAALAGPNHKPSARPRAARVNLLRSVVAEAVEWLRSPPEQHAKFAHPVSAPECPQCLLVLCIFRTARILQLRQCGACQDG